MLTEEGTRNKMQCFTASLAMMPRERASNSAQCCYWRRNFEPESNRRTKNGNMYSPTSAKFKAIHTNIFKVTLTFSDCIEMVQSRGLPDHQISDLTTLNFFLWVDLPDSSRNRGISPGTSCGRCTAD